MEGLLVLVALAAVFVPFVLPIMAIRRTRRLPVLEAKLEGLEQAIEQLRAENAALRRQIATAPVAALAPEAPQIAAAEIQTDAEVVALAALDELAATARREAEDGEASTVAATFTSPLPSMSTSTSTSTSTPENPSSPSSPPPPPPSPPINWEQWLGVRGAAVLGGIVLALAGILFFQYSIQHGLISPALRVVIGTLVGVGCLVGSTRLRKYETSANALAGGGAVILYASFWAARALYALIPMEVAFGLMALVTATTALFASRFRSLLIASLGLAGGLVTPLLLSTGQNRPIGLFGYLLVLDAGFLVVAYRRRWAGLALFALLGTLAIEALWIGHKMEPGQLAIALSATGLFALLFLASGGRAVAGERPLLWVVLQVAAIVLPHAFALYFAADARLGAHLYPIAILLLFLEIAALYLAATAPDEGEAAQLRLLPTLAGGGTLAVVGSWLGRAVLGTPLAWEAAGCMVALALPSVVAALRSPTRAFVPALLYPGGLFVLLAAAALGGPLLSPWPYESGLSALALLLLVQSDTTTRSPLALVAPALLGLALALLPVVHGDTHAFDRPAAYLLCELLLFLGVAAFATQIRERGADHGVLRRRALEGALLLGGIVLLGVAGWERLLRDPAAFVFGMSLLWGLVLVLLATQRRHGLALVVAALPLYAVHMAATSVTLHGPTRGPLVALACCGLAVALFARAPFFAWPALRGRVAFYVAALAGPAWLLPALALYRDRFGPIGQGGVALGLAAIGLTAMPSVRTRFALDAPERKSALAWVSAAALGLVSVAIPLELERQWITIGYALLAACVLLLWRQLDHVGLKYFALALAGVVGVRLVANPSVLLYADRGTMRVLNWVLYTYWVPAIALLVGSRTLAPLETARLRPWEEGLYRRPKGEPPHALVSIFLGLIVILVVFAWINLAIADWFGTGDHLTLDFERRPARDLSTSIAWALYAIVLLALGVWRRSSGLRWMSLGMLILTIGKVFLYDLGELKDLYRVVSLLGLAVSLIAVSLAYQRFVFHRGAAGPAPPEKA